MFVIFVARIFTTNKQVGVVCDFTGIVFTSISSFLLRLLVLYVNEYMAGNATE